MTDRRARVVMGLLLVSSFAATGLLGVASPAGAGEIEPAGEQEAVVIDIYWGDGCPFCHDAIEHLTAFAEAEDGVEVQTFEVWFDAENRARMERVADQLGVRADAVPLIVVGNQSWTGFNGAIGRSIESAVLELRGDVRPPDEVPAPDGPSSSSVVDVPLVGDMDLSRSLHPAGHRSHRPGRRVQPLLAVGPHGPARPGAAHGVAPASGGRRRHVPGDHHPHLRTVHRRRLLHARAGGGHGRNPPRGRRLRPHLRPGQHQGLPLVQEGGLADHP
ncbi:MAG: glutaredoxin family protein [Acidimicrobiales bacterium]|nr:glutaredoxin family protein [Acidimicrobiales bacterium]